jgi:hypothetical protein
MGNALWPRIERTLMSSSWARLVAMLCAALVVGRGRASTGAA